MMPKLEFFPSVLSKIEGVGGGKATMETTVL